MSAPTPPGTEDLAAHALDTAWARRSFDRAASTFDGAAVLHSEVRGNLLGRLELMTLAPRVVLDAGTGTGHAARVLKRRYPKAQVIALDSSRRMLIAAEQQQSWLRRFARVQADAHAVPLADGSVDLIVSNLMLPWCDPDLAFAEFRRVLAPRGLFCFTTYGPDTLRELRSAFLKVDSHPHVHQFIDMHDLGDALVRSGFAAPVLDVEHFTLRYLDVQRVAADLKATGARNATVGRPRGLMGRGKLATLAIGYEAFRQDGRLPATYEVVFGHAWAPAEGARRSDGTTVSLEEVRQKLRARRRP